MCQGTSFCEEEKLKRNRNGIEGSKPTAKHNPHVYSPPLRVHGSLLCPWPSGPGELLGDTKALEEGAECPEISAVRTKIGIRLCGPAKVANCPSTKRHEFVRDICVRSVQDTLQNHDFADRMSSCARERLERVMNPWLCFNVLVRFGACIKLRENTQFQSRIQADKMKIANERLDDDTLIFWHKILKEEHADALGSATQ